jgi:hypothetical protein
VIIGLSLVLGFMCGVVYSTRDFINKAETLAMDLASWIEMSNGGGGQAIES